MKSVFVVFSLILVYHQSSAQVDSLVNSGQSIATAKQLYDSGKYELAIKELNRIDPRDTNYIYSVSEKVKALIENKQYKESVAACESALKVHSPYRASLFHSLGLSHQLLGSYDRAISYINEGLNDFPFEYNLMYRLGIILYVQDRFDEAEQQFFKTLDFTPYHLGSHLYLSKIAMRRGNKVEGMLSMGIYLALNNEANTQLQILENFVSNELTDDQTIPSGSSVNPFTRLDALIRAKISFEDGYELKIPVKAGIVRQYQLLFDQLGNQNNKADSPWIRFYFKIYQDILNSGVQESFVYHILQSAPIKEVKHWSDNNKKTLQKFYEVINSSIKQFRGKRLLPEKWGYKNPVALSFDSEGRLESIGDNNEAGQKVGTWYFFDENAEILAHGNYAQGKKNDVWHYFKNDHSPSSVENLETGEIKLLYPNGNVQEHYYLKEGHTEGKFELFYNCGALKEARNYIGGKNNGPGKSYYASGKLKSEFESKDENLQGAFIRWRDSGTKESVTPYANGEYHGSYESYFPNGKVKTRGDYTHGKAEGIWSYYFENGKLKQRGTFQADTSAGVWETFNERGILTARTNYERHEDFDQADEFYSNGIRSEANRLKDGKMIELTYYDKSGAVLATYGNKEGTFKGKGHFPTGEIRVEFEYLNGNREGQWKLYTRSGSLEAVNPYENGSLNGPTETYFTSGALKSKSNYKEGKLDGLYAEYYSNGKIKSTGWFANGQKQQRWLNFYVDGAMESDMYFLNDEKVGYEIQFSENNKLSQRYDFDSDGTIKSLTKYNAEGKTSEQVTIPATHMSVFLKNKSGTIAYQSEFICGNREGETDLFLANGKPYRKLIYSNGERSGKYLDYFPDGSLEAVGSYAEGSPSGGWQWNNWNGTKFCEGRYLHGQEDSTWTYYYLNNVRSSLVEYLNGERDGDTQLFGLNGELVAIKKFEANDLVSYKVASKDGKMSDWLGFTGNETITSYYANGQVAISEQYKNGVFHGQRKRFYPDGKLYSLDEFLNGEDQGDRFVYFQNGKAMLKAHYKTDNAVGVWEYYDVNGNLTQRQTYLSGSLHGPTEFFVNGKVKAIQNFFSGFPID